MNKLLDTYVNKLIDLFDEEIQQNINKLRTKKKKQMVIDNISQLYRRWMYSSFIDESVASPVNMLNAIQKEDNFNNVYFPHIAVSGNISEGVSLSYSFAEYTLENHPLVIDAKYIMDQVNVVAVDKEGHVTDYSLMDYLHIKDTDYVDFLVFCLINMKLFKELPSIHAKTYQAISDYSDFFSRPHEEILSDFLNATLTYFFNEISVIIPAHSSIKKYYLNLLKNPKPMDIIFEEIFSDYGIDFNEIMDLQIDDFEVDDLSDMQNAFIASTFFIGVTLDKCFLTPFSYYFQFIRPIYTIPYSLNEEILFVCNDIEDAEDKDNGLYAPCSEFELTEIGKTFFGVKNNAQDFLEIEKKDLDKTIDLFIASYNIKNKPFGINSSLFFDSLLDFNDSELYQIKVKTLRNKNYFQTVLTCSDTPLTALHRYLAQAFHIEPNSKYEFFRKYEYSSSKPTKSKKTKKSKYKTLQDLDLKERDKFIYTIYDIYEPFCDESVKTDVMFEIEVLYILPDFNDLEDNQIKTITQSKKVKDWFAANK